MKTCLTCRNEFNPKPQTKGKFCSYVCYWENKKGSIPWNKDTKGIMKPNSGSFTSEKMQGKNNPNYGKHTYFFGKHLSDEHRKKIQEKLQNKKRPERSGANHHNWKGGVTSENEKIRKSLEYKVWHKAILKLDNYTCQECGIRGGKLEVDHIKAFWLYPELRLSLDNGRTLCKTCHKKVGYNYFREHNPKTCTGTNTFDGYLISTQ